jgi:hypothetical protein
MMDYQERLERYKQPDLTFVPKYIEPMGHGELHIGTQIKILLDHSYGKLATIVNYSFEYGEVWYNILPDSGYSRDSSCWYIHPQWFEVIP